MPCDTPLSLKPCGEVPEVLQVLILLGNQLRDEDRIGLGLNRLVDKVSVIYLALRFITRKIG